MLASFVCREVGGDRVAWADLGKLCRRLLAGILFARRDADLRASFEITARYHHAYAARPARHKRHFPLDRKQVLYVNRLLLLIHQYPPMAFQTFSKKT